MKWLLLILIFIIGCSDIDVIAIKKSNQFCKDKGELKYITDVLSIEYCECFNGDKILIKNINLKTDN